MFVVGLCHQIHNILIVLWPLFVRHTVAKDSPHDILNKNFSEVNFILLIKMCRLWKILQRNVYFRMRNRSHN